MRDDVKWITNGKKTPFYARKKLDISKKIQAAEASVCGLGQFHFYVNGKKAGDHELDPGWTDYRKAVQYVKFDITDDLKEGTNVLGAEVGNGWFLKTDEHYTFRLPEFMGPNPNPYRPFGESLILAVQVWIRYQDGSEQWIISDEGFRTADHPVVMSNVYGSETIDAGLIQKGWAAAEFDDSAWEKAVVLENVQLGVFVEQKQPPVKVIHTYEGRFLHERETDSGIRKIYDFGQNMSGILEFSAKGKKGSQIKIYPAEKLLENGDVDQEAKDWTLIDTCITCILGKDDEWETFRMKFTYAAGRFAAVEIPSAAGAEISIRGLKADAISSAWKTDGSFSCDDQRYVQIYSLVEKAVEANMVSVHTDCPTIERFAWQEPNHLMAPSIMYMKDGKKLWEKFLFDMRLGQHSAEDFFYDYDGKRFCPGEGLVPAQCPCYIPNVFPVPGMGSFYDIISWGSACILGAYWHYQFYGDQKVIKDNYQTGIAYLNYLKTKINEDGFINHGLGDWGNPRQELVRENIETAMLYADAVTLAGFAEILNRQQDKRKLEEFAETVRKNYNDKLLVRHPEKGYWCYRAWDHPDEVFMTQAAQALPLYWGMVPDDRTEDVVRGFRDTLEQEGAFISGEIGFPYIIQCAARYGMNHLISRFILRPEHPSYYAFVLDGETTLGEYWEKNPRSHCHDMMGHIVEWYYNGIAGIRPLEPGFKKIRICPYLPETMTEFMCSYASASGMIKVHVRELSEEIVLKVEKAELMICHIDIENLRKRGKKVNTEVLDL